MGFRIPPSSALLLGVSYHSALEHNYQQKIESEEDLQVQEVLDAYTTAFEDKLHEVEWTKEETEKGKGHAIGDLKDTGVGLVQTYQKVLAPKIQPAQVEEAFAVPFKNTDYQLEGRIDLIDNKGVLHDHKTSKKTPKREGEVYVPGPNEMVQAAIYCIATGKEKAHFDYAIKTKTPKIVEVEAQVPERNKAFTLRLIGKIDEAVKKGVFIPNRASFSCNRRMCGFWKLCEKEMGGTIRD